MPWLLPALVAHTANAAVFAVDKTLLTGRTSLNRPLHYALWSGVAAAAAVVLLPFVRILPGSFVLLISLLTAALHLLALWLFFIALRTGEPSRIVPLTGATVPIFTLFFAALFLNETLTLSHSLAVGSFILGGLLLAIHPSATASQSRAALAAALSSGALFAAYFAGMKYLYDSNAAPFLAAFTYSRLTEAALAFLFLVPVLAPRSPSKKSASRPARRGITALAFTGNKVLAAAAFVVQNYAISLGSVTIVNSLQGVQYIFLLLLAAAVSRWQPQWWREELNRTALWQKIAGITLISLGLLLIA